MLVMFQSCTHSADLFSRSCISSAELLKSSCCIPQHVASTCTSTSAAHSSGNLGLLGIAIGYSSSVQWIYVIQHLRLEHMGCDSVICRILTISQGYPAILELSILVFAPYSPVSFLVDFCLQQLQGECVNRDHTTISQISL